MGDLKARIKAKLLRRHSAVPSVKSDKQDIGRDRTSSSTHTQSSTTGYAASSLSTAAGDENEADDIGHVAKDKPGYGSVTKTKGTNNSPIRHVENAKVEMKNGSKNEESNGNGNVEGEGKGEGGQVETVPPELELLDRTGNGNALSSQTENALKAKANLTPSTPISITATSPTIPIPIPTTIKFKSTTNLGNDLHHTINPTLPTVTTPGTPTSPTSPTLPASPTSPTTVPDANLPAATPLPSIREHRPATTTLVPHSLLQQLKAAQIDYHHDDNDDHLRRPTSAGRTLTPSGSLSRPTGPPRRQSILPNRQTALIKTLLNTSYAADPGLGEADQLLPISGNMVTRKVWVKRPLASPTLITINEDDLVDDVRELILRKYANSLGRNFDAPDLSLRICDREQQTSRPLQPDEPMGRTLDAYYPGGQSVDDALLIDIPSRRTPKASPNPRFYTDDRPHESGNDYFPPYPPVPQHPSTSSATALNLNGTHQLHFPPSLAVINGGQLPPLPSPGSTRRLGSRPKMQRMHTASPVSTVANSHTSQTGAPPTTGMHNYPRQPRSRTHSGASSDQSNHPPAAPAIPTPPVPERTATPPPRVSSPRPINRPKKSKKPIEHPSLPPGMLNGGVPPINVLIVEDNIINLKLLEAFVKRLKVRWQTAMNGREAVNKWRAGGFHLVLMDIQLPVMSGLEATREIRRLEKVNSIGVFSSSASSPPDEVKAEPAEEDKLVNTEMFKSPVIIVALTASSLQSDRHEALAAGCNDFLTKVS